MTNLLPVKLAALRKHYQYSQSDLAENLHIPVQEYMNWENGNTICNIVQLKMIAQFYHVSLQDLADNTRQVVITKPKATLDDSVQIPFMNSIGKETDASDIEMTAPTEEIEDTVSVPASDDDEATLESTRIMNTQDFQPTTVNKIVDEDDYDDYEEEPVQKAKPAAPVQKKPAPAAAKKKLGKNTIIAIAIGAVALIAIVIFLIVNPFGKGSSNKLSIGNENRLTLAEKFSIYIDSNGKLITHGTNLPAVSEFTDTVQISSRSTFALGLKNDGTVVCSGAGTACDVGTWKDITMIAAGDNHSVGLKNDGTVVCAGSDSACNVGGWTDIEAVYAGNELTIGRKSDGTLVSSGTYNAANKITSAQSVSDVAIGDNEIAVVSSSGKVTMYAIGSLSTTDTSSLSGIGTAAVGDNFVAAMTTGGKVSIVTEDKDLKTQVEAWPSMKFIAARNNTLIGITADGQMYGAGDNTYNQYENSAEASASPSPTPTATAGTKLATPNSPSFAVSTANLTLTWDAVTGADYYEVTMNTNPTTSVKSAKNSASIPVSKLVRGNAYTITIAAYPKEGDTSTVKSDVRTVTYTYSAAATKLDKPVFTGADTSASKITIKWNAVSNADYYQVTLGTQSQKATGTSISFDTGNYQNGTQYTVSITAYSNDSSKYSASDASSDTYTYKSVTTQLANVGNAYMSAGSSSDTVTVSWDAVENAGSYDVKIGNTSKSVTDGSLSVIFARADLGSTDEVDIVITAKPKNTDLYSASTTTIQNVNVPPLPTAVPTATPAQ